MSERPVIPDHAPLFAAALVGAGLVSGTTCVVWPSHSGCSHNPDLHWPLWDPLVRAADRASGLPLWASFQDGGPLVPLIAAGPLLTSVLGVLALVVLVAWAVSRTAPTRAQVVLAVAGAGIALGLVPLGIWGSLLFMTVRL